ncbi:replication initiation negative regulator SeqA [Shewanella maritima]|uniref:replication initiation negative regulator SeqA n=1 Tax=Shewanella maritima TaxID=2520507 RepID=UPI0037351831
MKYIEIDEELYRFIAGKTERIGESASDILRRLLGLSVSDVQANETVHISQPGLETKPLSDEEQNALFIKAKEAVEKLVSTKHVQTSDMQTATTTTDAIDNQPAEAKLVVTAETETQTDNGADVVLSQTSNVEHSDIVNQSELAQQKGAVGRFMYLLENLAQLTGEDFSQVLQVQGKGRLYFARTKQELLDASKSANPKQIGEFNYWVSTNNNTAKKRTILNAVLSQLGCDAEKAKSISANI